jgi:hypothetical protein
MTCPLYVSSPHGNRLEVCGPRNAISSATSYDHIIMFCHSVTTYRNCPSYKLKASQWKRKVNRWTGLLRRILLSLRSESTLRFISLKAGVCPRPELEPKVQPTCHRHELTLGGPLYPVFEDGAFG